MLVVGLGRFGSSVANSLVRLGHEVLAVDEDIALVQRYASDFTHVLAADTTDTEALRQIGAEQFSHAVVGIGTDIEASVLTVLSLVELGVTEVWAKAINPKHARILERVGATHVVRPESAMGERVAHMVTGAMIDYIEFDDGFSIARTRAPKEMVQVLAGYVQDRWLMMVGINILLLIVGCLMDVGSAILILAPLLEPLAVAKGFDPIHFGIIMIANLEIGYLTPPVGLNLIVAMAAFKESFGRIVKAALPFVAIMLVWLGIIVVYPPLVLYLVGK